jgi:hypothetical protein
MEYSGSFLIEKENEVVTVKLNIDQVTFPIMAIGIARDGKCNNWAISHESSYLYPCTCGKEHLEHDDRERCTTWRKSTSQIKEWLESNRDIQNFLETNSK